MQNNYNSLLSLLTDDGDFDKTVNNKKIRDSISCNLYDLYKMPEVLNNKEMLYPYEVPLNTLVPLNHSDEIRVNEVVENTFGSHVEYIERENLLHVTDGNMGYFYDEVYKIGKSNYIILCIFQKIHYYDSKFAHRVK